jgi:hypothetical protein
LLLLFLSNASGVLNAQCLPSTVTVSGLQADENASAEMDMCTLTFPLDISLIHVYENPTPYTVSICVRDRFSFNTPTWLTNTCPMAFTNLVLEQKALFLWYGSWCYNTNSIHLSAGWLVHPALFF